MTTWQSLENLRIKKKQGMEAEKNMSEQTDQVVWGIKCNQNDKKYRGLYEMKVQTSKAFQ